MSRVADLKFLNALIITFGSERTRKLLQRCRSAERAWSAGANVMARAGFQAKTIAELTQKRATLDPDEAWQKLKEAGVGLVSLDDERYPPLLKEIYSPPLALYARGKIELLQSPIMAVVGTRAPSSYGRGVLPAFVETLAAAGLTIASGLAQGIDALAHRAALEAGGNTLAVLGSGLDQIFPKINEPLAKAILEQGGLIISEYPLGMPPLKQHFPARNRIIAGLSLGVFVVESREPGGSLITAQHGLESGREIFALPGPVGRATSAGTNRLIQQGAKLVRHGQDILEELALPAATAELRSALENLNAEEQNVLQILETEPLHIDTIIKKAKLKPAQANALLTALELKGAVRNNGGNIYERTL